MTDRLDVAIRDTASAIIETLFQEGAIAKARFHISVVDHPPRCVRIYLWLGHWEIGHEFAVDTLPGRVATQADVKRALPPLLDDLMDKAS